MVRDPRPAGRAPDPACRRDWVPVEAPKRRRSSKHEDEPVRRAGGIVSGPVGEDERVGVEVLPECVEVQSGTGGDVDA